MTEIYTVKVGEFEGPLDALLGIVSEKKLSINDISLSQIADDFLAYVKNLPVHNKELIISFLGTTATLLLIKSVTLLPGIPLTEDEAGDIHELELRLALYKEFKEIGATLVRGAYKRKIFFQKNAPQMSRKKFAPHTSITQESLQGTLLEFFKNNPIKETLPEVQVESVISLEEMITNLVQKINEAPKLSFHSISGFGNNGGEKGRVYRLNVIISFLALLELVKQELINMEQENPYEDITIHAQKV